MPDAPQIADYGDTPEPPDEQISETERAYWRAGFQAARDTKVGQDSAWLQSLDDQRLDEEIRYRLSHLRRAIREQDRRDASPTTRSGMTP